MQSNHLNVCFCRVVLQLHEQPTAVCHSPAEVAAHWQESGKGGSAGGWYFTKHNIKPQL